MVFTMNMLRYMTLQIYVRCVCRFHSCHSDVSQPAKVVAVVQGRSGLLVTADGTTR